MSCVNMREILQDALSGHYAVAAFNTIDFATTKSMIEVAEQLRAPLIVQVSVKTIELWGHEDVQSWYRLCARRTRVPVALHLDHCRDVDFVGECIRHGWTSVMFDGSSLPYEENVALTQRVLRMARPAGVTVEAELGQIGGVEDDIAADKSHVPYTDAEQAKDFLSRADVDLFAPNIGTAHGLYKDQPRVDFDLISRIARENRKPIALHGGSGLTDDAFRRAIAAGCAKVNISTSLKHAFVKGFEEYRSAHASEVEPVKILAHQRDLIREVCERHIRLFGGAGKA